MCLAAGLRLPSLAVRMTSCYWSTLFLSFTRCAISVSVSSQGLLLNIHLVSGNAWPHADHDRDGFLVTPKFRRSRGTIDVRLHEFFM